jgi:hypothetical protein
MHGTSDPLDGGRTLGDNLVLTITGDTCKDPNDNRGWGDGTPDNVNVLIAYDGSGRLAGGAFGGVGADGSTSSFDPGSGAVIANAQASDHANAAAPVDAAVLSSVAKGDSRRVGDFYRGASYTGLLNPELVGIQT